MSRDDFSILGLKPGRYEPGQIAQHFRARRERLLAGLDDPARYAESRRQLDELYRAYNALHHSRRQADLAEPIRATGAAQERVAQLRELIRCSLEGGLLRYSRRVQILAEGRRLGFSDFHTHLMIAQVQFDGEIVAPPSPSDAPPAEDGAPRVRARFAAAGILALAIFLAMIRWLGT